MGSAALLNIMHMFSAEFLLARAVFTRSIRVHGWQPGSQNPWSTIFRKKHPYFEIHRTSETSMGSLSLRNHVYVHIYWFCIPLKSCIWALQVLYQPEQCLQGQLRCTECSQGSQNPGSTIFEKKNVLFFNFIGPVTPPWVLHPSEIMHLGSTEILLARAVFTRSIKVPGWQPGASKPREHDFPEKNVLIF